MFGFLNCVLIDDFPEIFFGHFAFVVSITKPDNFIGDTVNVIFVAWLFNIVPFTNGPINFIENSVFIVRVCFEFTYYLLSLLMYLSRGFTGDF